MEDSVEQQNKMKDLGKVKAIIAKQQNSDKDKGRWLCLPHCQLGPFNDVFMYSSWITCATEKASAWMLGADHQELIVTEPQVSVPLSPYPWPATKEGGTTPTDGGPVASWALRRSKTAD